MFIELVEHLRCVRPHEAGWLVASCDVMDGRDIVTGMLGCPVCGTRYPIVDGVADFTDGKPALAAEDVVPVTADSSELALRAAAWLDLASPGGLAVLAGGWTRAVPTLDHVIDDIHILAIDPVPDITRSSHVSIARTATVVPLRDGVARGIALDVAHGAAEYVESAVRALRQGGRLLAPHDVLLPERVTEIARDEQLLLATRDVAPSPVVPLRRAPTEQR